MEEKNTKKIEIPVIFIILIIILIIAVGVLIYKLNNKEDKGTENTTTKSTARSTNKENKFDDVILDGMYSYEEPGDNTFNFTKDGKAASGGNMYLRRGTYETIGENYIEIHYTEYVSWDEETFEESTTPTDEYEHISIDGDDIYLINSAGGESKIERIGDVNTEDFE